MNFVRTLKEIITNKNRRFICLAYSGFYRSMPDEEYLRRMYEVVMEKKLDLNTPCTFNEKLQWLKINDRDPLHTVMVDKYLVKDYVSNIIGNKFIIPTLGVWDNPNEINFDLLPNQFVLKCNHNSGLGMCICKDKKNIDIKEVKKKLGRGLKENYYLLNREWPYKDVDRKIIAEKYMLDDSSTNDDLPDYKVHCFNGVPKLILVCKDRFSNTGMTEDFFTSEWEHLDLRRPTQRQSEERIPVPDKLPEMLDLSRRLAQGLKFVRIDFYVINGHVYFGEITFFPASGFKKFLPEGSDEKIGSWIDLA